MLFYKYATIFLVTNKKNKMSNKIFTLSYLILNI